MKNNKLKILTRLALILCGFALLAVLFAPMWRIELNAPQYPEGLKLLIFANKLGGNVDIINGLNHYIGMKTLHTADFIEFTILPYVIVFFMLAFLLTGILAKRKWLNLLLILFISFGTIAMIDFWRWEYNYGHNLNPDAAIIVPGMAYQPPLIGFKQLLNFGAYSVPDLGGWIFVGVGVTLLFLVISEWVRVRKINTSNIMIKAVLPLLLVVAFSSCNSGPEALVIGKDNCTFCKMTISDNRFGAELVTKKGKLYKFDDGHCLISFIQGGGVDRKEIADVYLTDYGGQHRLLNAEQACILQGEYFRGPMNGNIAAFSNADSVRKMADDYKAVVVTWNQINK